MKDYYMDGLKIFKMHNFAHICFIMWRSRWRRGPPNWLPIMYFGRWQQTL